MDHDHDPYRSGAQPPRSLPGQLRGFVLGLVLDAEHFGEILSQGVAGPCLDPSAGDRHKPLN